MTQFDPAIQAQVDGQLMEQGAYTALEFLIHTGRLIFSDYEGWRRGEIEFLDDLLMGAKGKIRAQIEQAAEYARGIGLVEQPQEFHPWRASSARDNTKALRISADPHFHQLVVARYVPAQAVPQMDLFFDNPAVALANGVVRALATRALGDAQQQLDRLYARAPNHPDLPAFDRLVAVLERLNEPVADSREELKFLLDVTPAARRLLGPQARDLLAPLWRQLADALSGRVHSGREPDLHRSFALIQAQDWAGVRECIRAESDWQHHAPLCLRLARSSFYRQDRIEALTGWYHLCWRHPECVAREIENPQQPDAGIAAAWARFQDRDLDGPLLGASDDDHAASAGDFPAWMLLHEPGLAQHLPPDLPAGDTPGEEHYRQVHRWIQARRTNRHAEELALRKTIQASSPLLFECLKQTL